MKKLIIIFLIFLISSFFFLEKENINVKQKKLISGELIDVIESGKDGSTWKIKTSDNRIYNVTISVANLKDKESQNNFFCLKKKTFIQFSGETIIINNKKLIIVRKLKINSYSNILSMIRCKLRSI